MRLERTRARALSVIVDEPDATGKGERSHGNRSRQARPAPEGRRGRETEHCGVPASKSARLEGEALPVIVLALGGEPRSFLLLAVFTRVCGRLFSELRFGVFEKFGTDHPHGPSVLLPRTDGAAGVRGYDLGSRTTQECPTTERPQ